MLRKLIKIAVFSAFIAMMSLPLTLSAEPEHQYRECRIKFSNAKISDEGISTLETMTAILKGVVSSEFSKEEKLLTVNYDANKISTELIVFTVESLGFKPTEVTEKSIGEGESSSEFESDNYFDYLKESLVRKNLMF